MSFANSPAGRRAAAPTGGAGQKMLARCLQNEGGGSAFTFGEGQGEPVRLQPERNRHHRHRPDRRRNRLDTRLRRPRAPDASWFSPLKASMASEIMRSSCPRSAVKNGRVRTGTPGRPGNVASSAGGQVARSRLDGIRGGKARLQDEQDVGCFRQALDGTPVGGRIGNVGDIGNLLARADADEVAKIAQRQGAIVRRLTIGCVSAPARIAFFNCLSQCPGSRPIAASLLFQTLACADLASE